MHLDGLPSFERSDFIKVSEALDIAEDKVGDFFKFSFEQWKRHQYDVKTRSTSNGGEVSTHAFAKLNKYSAQVSGCELNTCRRDFYFICLQDRPILRAVERDGNIKLLSLLVYIFTHELIHIVRFSNFHQRFEIAWESRGEEEKVVHKTTFEILKDLSLPNMDYILDSYESHRVGGGRTIN